MPLSLEMEASGRLVGPPVFKTGVPATSWQAGSIPVRLREPIGGIDPSEVRVEVGDGFGSL
jgi:hypothetical protein